MLPHSSTPELPQCPTSLPALNPRTIAASVHTISNARWARSTSISFPGRSTKPNGHCSVVLSALVPKPSRDHSLYAFVICSIFKPNQHTPSPDVGCLLATPACSPASSYARSGSRWMDTTANGRSIHVFRVGPRGRNRYANLVTDPGSVVNLSTQPVQVFYDRRGDATNVRRGPMDESALPSTEQSSSVVVLHDPPGPLFLSGPDPPAVEAISPYVHCPHTHGETHCQDWGRPSAIVGLPKPDCPSVGDSACQGLSI